jgi:hypothetical protein
MTKGPCRMVWAPVPLHELHLFGVVPGLHLLPLQVSHFIVLAYSTDYLLGQKRYFSSTKYTFAEVDGHVHNAGLVH